MRFIIIVIMVVCFISGCSKSVENDSPEITNSVSHRGVSPSGYSGLLSDKTTVSGQMR